MKITATGVCSLAALTGIVFGTATAGTFIQPVASGTTPSGIPWSAVATGTALPVRTSGTNPFNGAPGAVIYVDVTTGQAQFDPKGLNVANFVLTYNTGTGSISDADSGPFFYATGTDGFASISTTTGPQLTFPAVTSPGVGTPPTVQPARVGMAIGSPLAVPLATSGNAGNIASSNGWWNQGWAFPTDLIASGSLSAVAATFTSGSGNNYFRTTGNASHINANVLGYGSQQGVFYYSVNGLTGGQLGPVVPVPEPSTCAILAAGITFGCWQSLRRPQTASPPQTPRPGPC